MQSRIYITLIIMFGIGCTNGELHEDMLAIKNVEDVTSVEITGETGSFVRLEKMNIGWVVNGLPASDYNINKTLQTLSNLVIVRPVPKGQKEKVMKTANAAARKVTVFAGDKILRTYYFTGLTNDKTGTYVYSAGFDDPYIVGLANFRGHILPYFSPIEKEWRDKILFQFQPHDIKTVKVEFPYDQLARYTFQNNNENQTLETEDGQQKTISKVSAFEFLSAFDLVPLEGFEEQYGKKDSIKASTPYAKIEITDALDKAHSISLFYMPINQKSKISYDDDGNQFPFDPDHYFAVYNGNFIMVQDYIFRNILWPIEKFK